MCNTEYGYARVSSKDQHPDRQINALLGAGLISSNIVVEKQSGKDFRRQKYEALLRKLRRGDTLYLMSLDRLGRNYREIIEQWQHITRDIGADIVVLDMPLLDTRNKARDLTGTFVTAFTAANSRVHEPCNVLCAQKASASIEKTAGHGSWMQKRIYERTG